MFTLIQIDVKNRGKIVSLFLIAVFVLSLFTDWHLVVPIALLVLIRINQILNQKEYIDGYLGFLFNLPVSRRSVLTAKILVLLLLIFVVLFLSWTANTVSVGLLGFEMYTEEMNAMQLNLFFLIFSFIGLLTNLIILRMYLLLGVKKMLTNTRILAISLLVFVGFFYTQVIHKITPLSGFIQQTFQAVPYVYGGIAVLVISLLIGLTYLKIEKIDIKDC